MGDLVTPRTDFDFEIIDKGEYKFKVKETKIVAQAEGKTSGKQFLAVCTVMGGNEDGKNHFERFLEITKDNFSLSKLAGFLIKVGVLKPTGPIDVALFKTPAFEKKWLEAVPGREFGMKISHRTTGIDGKKLDNPQSEAKSYYSIEEINAILAKKGTAVDPGEKPTPAETATTPSGPSVWD